MRELRCQAPCVPLRRLRGRAGEAVFPIPTGEGEKPPPSVELLRPWFLRDRLPSAEEGLVSIPLNGVRRGRLQDTADAEGSCF